MIDMMSFWLIGDYVEIDEVCCDVVILNDEIIVIVIGGFVFGVNGFDIVGLLIDGGVLVMGVIVIFDRWINGE